MSSTQIDPENVIRRLSQQVGALSAELAMRDEALEVAHARIAELQKGSAEPTAE